MDCHACEGTGEILCPGRGQHFGGSGHDDFVPRCSLCQGVGYLVCSFCGGTGFAETGGN